MSAFSIIYLIYNNSLLLSTPMIKHSFEKKTTMMHHRGRCEVTKMTVL